MIILLLIAVIYLLVDSYLNAKTWNRQMKMNRVQDKFNEDTLEFEKTMIDFMDEIERELKKKGKK